MLFRSFGFNLPGLDIFDRVAGKAATPQLLDSVAGEAKRAYRDAFDKWVIELTDGAVWRQIDSEVLAPSPRAGSKVEIRRAAFGSFLMKIDSQRPVRARRSQ